MYIHFLYTCHPSRLAFLILYREYSTGNKCFIPEYGNCAANRVCVYVSVHSVPFNPGPPHSSNWIRRNSIFMSLHCSVINITPFQVTPMICTLLSVCYSTWRGQDLARPIWVLVGVHSKDRCDVHICVSLYLCYKHVQEL